MAGEEEGGEGARVCEFFFTNNPNRWGGGKGGRGRRGARVSEIFFTKNLNLKNFFSFFFFFLGGGGGGVGGWGWGGTRVREYFY